VTITLVVASVSVGITSTVIDLSDADDTHSQVAEPDVGSFWARHHGIALRFSWRGRRDDISARDILAFFEALAGREPMPQQVSSKVGRCLGDGKRRWDSGCAQKVRSREISPRRNHVEIATAEWVLWFNTERPHEYLDDFTPEAIEKLHYDHRRTPPKAG
jgi:transposase InsO family protein